MKRIPIRTWSRDSYEISTNPARLDFSFVHRELSRSYWAKGISRKSVERSFGNSPVVFGIYRRGGPQVGFARLITDAVRFAYLMDVVVTRSERRKGLGSWLMRCVVRHLDLKQVGFWLLATRDAHGLYRKSGWKPLSRPKRLMELRIKSRNASS